MTTEAIRESEKDDVFFDALARGQPPGASAKSAGYTLAMVRERRKSDAEFERRWKEADELAIERMEADASQVETLVSGVVTASGIFWSLWHHTPDEPTKPTA